MKTSWKFYFFALLAYAMPLLLANIYYIDDNGRATAGYTNWGVDGRPLADSVMKLLFLSSHMVDIFPLPLFIAIALLAAVLARYHAFFFTDTSRWIALLATLSFFANPYLAEIFSYRFDVLTLSCALALSVGWILIRFTRRPVQFIAGTAAIIAIYCLYQIAINIAVMMAILFTFYQMVKNDAPWRIANDLLQRAAEVVTASVIYLKIILPMTFSGDHPANHPGIATQGLAETISANFHVYRDFIAGTFYKSGQGMTVLLVVLALSLVSASLLTWRYVCGKQKASGIRLFWLAPLLPLAAFIMMFGSLLFLQQPVLVPRALIGISGFMLFSATLSAWAMRGNLRVINGLFALLLLYALTAVYAYGNALREQENINTGLIAQLKQDTDALSAENLFIQFRGNAPQAEVYNNALRNYPVLATLIPQYFANWWFPYPYMGRKGYVMPNPLKEGIAVTEQSIMASLCHGQRIAQHQDYDLYRYQDRLTVDFTLAGCPR